MYFLKIQKELQDEKIEGSLVRKPPTTFLAPSIKILSFDRWHFDLASNPTSEVKTYLNISEECFWNPY